MFAPVENNVSFPKLEEEILKFWRENKIYERSLTQREGCKSFVFFEGPPTANGKPHPGHCLTRAMKDLFPRYKTMQGYRCERRAGWDTHGLPVEVEVCKELGIHSKEEIEAFGVEEFIQRCQKSVWRYMQEWERLTERLGFWVNLDEAYVTYHQSYIESVWWSLKQFFDKGLLYKGHKIVWWWAQGGTALSSGEVGQGYRQVADPSAFVLFPLVDDPKTNLLVWTTTPWTLPSNQFAAVNANIEYATVLDVELDKRIVLARDLVEKISEKVKRELRIESVCKGSEWVGKRYVPPFDYFHKTHGQKTGRLKSGGQQHIAWRIVAADFVTTESGSGAVHEAPAFGEVDFELLRNEQDRFVQGEGPALICPVEPNGKFMGIDPDLNGLWVKDADKIITRKLKQSGSLYLLDQYLHEYPFCWRADEDPLIQYPRESWFIRTTQFRDQMLENNRKINWLPEHIGEGRFGNFLESNVDWALSRERFWGTPLPIWVCDQTGMMEGIGSYEELMQKPGVTGQEVWEAAKKANPELPEDLKIHKPYIDHVSYASPHAPGATMRRVSEVIDCWYDSGAMPFAQWGFPHKNAEGFNRQFPADFISEAIDQTRGWFYSLLAISTLLSDGTPTPGAEENTKPRWPNVGYPQPFRNCIVLGLMLGEDGQKMSKSKRNYREPGEIFEKYGADALRWYFFANQPPWTSIRYREQAIKDSIPEFLLRLWNVYSFFVNYANTDDFDPSSQLKGTDQLVTRELESAMTWRKISHRSELDRWILSELNKTISDTSEKMDAYDSYGACQTLNSFLDGLSNWYVRRSRDRFWSTDKNSPEKLDAYWTLYECLLATVKMISPFVPFVSEAIWQNLSSGLNSECRPSVHLADYPQAQQAIIDEDLSQQMNLLREIASLGRAARMEAKLKVRQPLKGVTVILNSDKHVEWLQSHDSILKEELNVKGVTYQSDAGGFVSYEIQPNFKRLGPKVGKLLPKLKQILADCSGAELLGQLSTSGNVKLMIEGGSIELTDEDIQVKLKPKAGWAAAQGRQCVVVLSTELTDELIQEGIVRDVVRLIQDYRKQRELDFSDRIDLVLHTDSSPIKVAVDSMRDFVCGETLALSLEWRLVSDSLKSIQPVADGQIEIFLTKSKSLFKA